MFLRLKRDGSIKGIPVAGGNRQRELISKEDVIYPSVATEEVLLACIVDTQEGRYVVIVDTPKNFIKKTAEKEEDIVTIRFRGDLVDVLLEIAPEL